MTILATFVCPTSSLK